MNILRLVLALAGFALALLSIAFDSRLLGWIAIGALIGSLLLRIVLRKRSAREPRLDRDT